MKKKKVRRNLMDKYEKIGWIWVIAGFIGIISLGFRGEITTWETILILIFTIVSFCMALHFIMHDYEKKEKDEAEK